MIHNPPLLPSPSPNVRPARHQPLFHSLFSPVLKHPKTFEEVDSWLHSEHPPSLPPALPLILTFWLPCARVQRATALAPATEDKFPHPINRPSVENDTVVNNTLYIRGCFVEDPLPTGALRQFIFLIYLNLTYYWLCDVFFWLNWLK